VIITGTNFNTTPSDNTVVFNGTPAIETISTPTQIVTTVPVGAITGPITVTVGGFSAKTTNNFTVTVLMGESIQGLPTSLAGTVTTLVEAGTFSVPAGLTTDGTYLYVSNSGAGIINKIQ
jgi:hypothetical protein